MNDRQTAGPGEAPHFATELPPEAPDPDDTNDVLGRRIVAAVLDLVGANIAGAAGGLSIALPYALATGNYGGSGEALLYLGAALAVVAYFVGLEATLGQTPGKFLMGLRVIHADGQRVGWGGAVARNLLRVVDGLFLYLVGFLVAMLNPMRQRLGDLAADTVVVDADLY